MRWRYFDPSNPPESAEHAAVLARIDRWWQQFATKTRDLDDPFANRSKWDLPDWMNRELGAVNENLMWEYGPALGGKGHRLAITPESQKQLRPMVQTLLQRAPTLPGWEFYAYRPAEDVAMAQKTVTARTGGDISETLVTAAIGEHNRIDLCYLDLGTRGDDDQQAFHNAFVATETLLGEEILDKWVGVISVERLRKPGGLKKLLGRDRQGGPSPVPLDRLKPTALALIASMQDQLPQEPCYVLQPGIDSGDSQTPHFVMRITPTPADDYPGYLDLFVAVGTDEGRWRALHQDGIFYSVRYSRHGETFCYLKLDGSESLDEEKFPDRSSIEDALNKALVPARLGCVIGGGTGLRYSYIDLALADVDAALAVIRSRLRADKLTKRSWLLFFDTPLADEWIGVYDDSPPPP